VNGLTNTVLAAQLLSGFQRSKLSEVFTENSIQDYC